MRVTKGDVTVEDIETIEQLRDVLNAIGTHQTDRRERRTIQATFPTLRLATVGDVFKFKKPPPGWTSGAILVVDKMPGYAAPEGMDYLPIDLLDGEIEWIEGPHCQIKGQCQDLDGDGTCKGCGRWLGDGEEK